MLRKGVGELLHRLLAKLRVNEPTAETGVQGFVLFSSSEGTPAVVGELALQPVAHVSAEQTQHPHFSQGVFGIPVVLPVPILAEFGTWLTNIARDVLPKSPIGEALRYTQNQWEALERYTTDGDLSIDNNLSERTVKIAALGRKNWMFVGSPKGGRRAAVLLSLVASAKANHVEPWAWLRDVFTQLPDASPETLDHLLPDRWLDPAGRSRAGLSPAAEPAEMDRPPPASSWVWWRTA